MRCSTMQLSRRQLRTFRRINAKLQTVPAFYVQHFPQIMHHFRRQFRRLHNLVNATRLIKLMRKGRRRQRVIIASRRFRRRGILRAKAVSQMKPKLRMVWGKRKGKLFVKLREKRPKKRPTTRSPKTKNSAAQNVVAAGKRVDAIAKPTTVQFEGVSKSVAPSGDVVVAPEPESENIFQLAMGSPLHETSYDNPPIDDPISEIQFARVIEDYSDQMDVHQHACDEDVVDKLQLAKLAKNDIEVDVFVIDSDFDCDEAEIVTFVNGDANGGTAPVGGKLLADSVVGSVEAPESDLETSLIIDESYNSDLNNSTHCHEDNGPDQSECSVLETEMSEKIINKNKCDGNNENDQLKSVVKKHAIEVDTPTKQLSSDAALPSDPQSTPNPISDASAIVGASAAPATTTDLNNQLREQLCFFKMGKRKESFLGEPIGGALRGRSADASRTSTPSFSRNTSIASIEDHMITNTPKKPIEPTQKTPDKVPVPKRNFIDSLINRIKLNTNIESISSTRERSTGPTLQERPRSDHDPPTTASKKSIVSMLLDGEISDHSESTDFLGFNTTDMTASVRLSTPVVVPKSSVTSAFVSEALDTFMKENALENSANIVMPVVRFCDDALISDASTPPHLMCPQLPTHIEKPRTLAAKREQLEGQTDVKLLMIENETSVFRELRKRTRVGHVPSYRHIRSIQERDIPFTRDCWRATSWLATRAGRYYYQTVRTKDGQMVNVISGRGDHEKKFLFKFSTKIDAKSRVHRCSGKCRSLKGIRIDNLSLLEPISLKKKSKTNSESTSHLSLIKPNTLSWFNRNTTCGPLSKKQLLDEGSSLDLELGPLQIYHMPAIHLEVWPTLEDPLPEQVRPFLKVAMPYNCMTSKWVNFALTALKVPIKENYTTLSGRSICKASYKEDTLAASPKLPKMQPTRTKPMSFVFDIPYANDQRRLLIRKRKKLQSICSIGSTANGGGGHLDSNDCLTFDREVDADDRLALDVANVLRGMLDAVEISANETTLWQKDPDFKHSVDAPDLGPLKNNFSESEVLIRKETTSSMRIRNELKRLNATIIDNYEVPAKVNCTEDFCKMGCVCDSLTISKNYPQHCKRVQCMFECSCNVRTLAAMESRNSNIEQLRHRANACLAKEEKEFRATVVLSQDRTIYIPNQENVGKRNKRVPKRFHDSVEFPFTSQAPLNAPAANKPKPDVAGATGDQTATAPSASFSTTKSTRLQAELHRMGHCNVSLAKMPPLDSLEPWCMIHCLYKCFCKLRAVSGKPFTFQERGAIIPDPDESYVPAKKRQYTFDKTPIESAAINVEPAKKRLKPIEKSITLPEKSSPLHVIDPRAESNGPASEYPRGSARTRPFIRSRPMRSRKDVLRMNDTYRKFEEDNPTLKKLLNLHKRRCWLNSGTNGMCVVESNEASLPGASLLKKPTMAAPSEKVKRPAQKQNVVSESIVRPSKDTTIQLPSVPKASERMAQNRIPTACIVAGSATNEESSRMKHEHNLKYFNYCVNKTMDQVKSAQISTVMVKPPQPKNLNCIQWNRLVPLYLEEKVFVWQIQLQSMEIILGLTLENVMPLVPGALSVMNIRIVPIGRLVQVAKMLKQGLHNARTAQLAVLLHGAANYWQIISTIYSNKNYMVEDHRVQPTPQSHPQLASKIAKLFNLLTKNRSIIRKGQPQPTPTPASSRASTPQSTTAAAPVAAPPVAPQIPVNPKTLDPRFMPKCNITMTPDRNIAAFLPVQPAVGEHKWFMLAFAPDFTHIFIRSWNSFLSYEKIKSAIVMAKHFGKTVKISAPNIMPDVFAAPNEPGKVFFGPYSKDAVLEMGLYYSLNNKIMPTEEYLKILSKQQGAPALMVRRSTGCWLNVIQTPPEAVAHKKAVASSSKDAAECSAAEVEHEVGAESDEDCMIIEEPQEVIDIPEDDVEPLAAPPVCQIADMVSLSPPASTSYQPPSSTTGQLSSLSQLKVATPKLPTVVTTDSICSIDKSKSPQSKEPTNKTMQLPKISLMDSLKNACNTQLSPAVALESLKSKPRQFADPKQKVPLAKVSKMAASKKTSNAPDQARKLLPKPSLPPPLSLTLTPKQPATKPPIDQDKPMNPFLDITQFPNTLSNITIFRLPSTDETVAESVAKVKTAEKPQLPSQPNRRISIVEKHLGKVMKLPKSLVISKLPPAQKRSISEKSDTEPPTKKQSPPTDKVSVLPISECIDLGSDDETKSSDPPAKTITRPAAVIKGPKVCGYLVSTLGSWMGRLAAFIQDDYYHTDVFGKGLAAIDVPTMNKLLEIQIRQMVYAVEPRFLPLEWTFVGADETDKWKPFPRMNPLMFQPTTIITEHCMIDLRSDFESKCTMSRELLLRLLLLKLAYLCRCDREEVRTSSFNEILRKGEAQIKNYVARDAKFESLKMSWAIKMRTNKMKLESLQRKMGVSPKPPAQGTEAVPRKRPVVGGAMPRASLMPPPPTSRSSSDVIEIDDDDDECGA